MALLTGLKTERRMAAEYQSVNGYTRRDSWTAPAAASAAAQLSAQNLDGSTVTVFLAQPDFARALTLVASGATTANVVVTGKDVRGTTVTETIALNGATPVTTVRAYKSLTSLVVPNVGATTLNVGTSALLGLSRKAVSAGDVLYGVSTGVKETTIPVIVADATDVSKNTVSFTSAPNGTRNLSVVYLSTELTDK